MVLWIHDLSDIPIDLLKVVHCAIITDITIVLILSAQLTNYLKLEGKPGLFLTEASFNLALGADCMGTDVIRLVLSVLDIPSTLSLPQAGQLTCSPRLLSQPHTFRWSTTAHTGASVTASFLGRQ